MKVFLGLFFLYVLGLGLGTLVRQLLRLTRFVLRRGY